MNSAATIKSSLWLIRHGETAWSATGRHTREWDYGGYEGRTSAHITAENPGWTLWDGGVPGGETLAEVGVRADRVLARAISAPGDVAFFAHGHLLRIVAVRWLSLAPAMGRFFALDAASVSILGSESEQHVIELWNDVGHLAGKE